MNVNADTLCAALEEGGDIAARLSGYERRDSQLALLRLIVRGFNEDAVIAAEAGTGVGKSFAYLLPALEFALAAGERVVISTATITLQQQLYEKDIPLVLSTMEKMGKDVKCVMMKGRANYLCRRRLAEAQKEPPLDNAEYDELRALSEWAETTKGGGKSELSFLPQAALWSRLCCESDTCLGIHCAERERCFFMALRREAADARLIVVNHHLLFADLAARHEGAGYEAAVVLPPFNRVIIDEAHSIENSATSFFSRGWSRLGINRALSRLYRKRRTQERGLLLRLNALLPAPRKTPADSAAGKNAAAKVVAAAREAAEQADIAAIAICGEEGLFRFTPGRGDTLGALRPTLEKLQKAMYRLTSHIRSMTDLVDEEDAAVWEVKAIARRLEAVAEIAGEFLTLHTDNSSDDKVFWLEKQGGFREDPWVSFTVTPVSVAPALKEALFEANKTVVCVSATLSTSGDDSGDSAAAFRFWAERSGAALAGRNFYYGAFPSPFPYNTRALLAAPSDAPMPDSPDYPAFTARAITGLVRAAGGSALILFTSYQALRNAYEETAPGLERQGIRCLKQGGDDRTRLLRAFLEDKTSVLFGTDSFWEGVDAPGETLRLLILCRLPFKTLRDPVFEARREALEHAGRSSFAELSLPDAVMKFKQGFGRLMRNSSDYGAVVVLDGRILRKSYGRIFLGALPETKTSFRELEDITRDLERFLYD